MKSKLKRVVSIVLAAALLIPTAWLAPTVEAADTTTQTVYHETFASGIGKATKSGGANLTQVTDKVFEGNADGKALYVSNRKDNWDAADFMFSDIGLEDGKTYTVTIKGYVDADADVPTVGTPQAYFQSLRWLASANFAAGQAFTITKEFTVNSSTDTRIRVQSSEDGKTVPFYIGDILVTTEEPNDTGAGNIVYQEGFETNNGGWGPISWVKTDADPAVTDGVASVTTDVSSEGSHSLLLSNRTKSTSGLFKELTGKMLAGHTYDISLKVRMGQGPDNLHLTSNVNVGGGTWVTNPQAVTATGWTTITKTGYQVPAETSQYNLWIESTTTNDIYLDEIIIKDVTPPPSVTLATYDFEGGSVQGWNADTAVASVTDMPHTGSYSLLASARGHNYNGAAINATNLLKLGGKYTLSAYVRLKDNAADTQLKMTVKRTTSSGTKYDEAVALTTVTNGAWVSLEKTDYTFSEDTTQIILLIEGNNTESFYLDDVTIVQTAPPPTDTGGETGPVDTSGLSTNFENNTLQNWTMRSGKSTPTVSNADKHSGSYSLLSGARNDKTDGPMLDITSKLAKNHKYHFSAWVKMAPDQGTAMVNMALQIDYNGGGSYPWIVGATQVTESGWVHFETDYTLKSNFSTIHVYFETGNTAGTQTFYVDDFELTYLGEDKPVPVQTNIGSIAETYKSDFLIGNAVSATDLEGSRLELLKLHHNVVTAENAMKPESLYAADKTFTPTGADALVSKVLAAGLQMHGHVLVWHQQTPTWLNTSTVNNIMTPLSREEALANLKTHIETVMEHFGNKVISWDVVNEAMNDNPANPSDWEGALRQSPWKSAIGPDYVEQAYLAAREVLDAHPDWNIKLYYNDYNDDNPNKAQAIYSMVKEINDKYALAHDGKLLIDGIGMQGHYNVNTSPENVEMSLEKFISLGVEVSVSELDITAGTNSQLPENLAEAQGYLYAQLFKIYKAHAANISRVTFWGLNDSSSWRASQNPLLFDKDLQAKPAYYGVIDPSKFMEEHEPASSANANQSTAKFATPVIDGTVDAAWSGASEIPINRYQMAWQGAHGVAKALWDDQNLYVLVQVSDVQLDKTSANAYEEDSVEIFLDQNNAKKSFYQDDDGQYRVNFDNETSFNPSSIADGFESKTKISGTNYTVEVKIPLNKITPANDSKIGFDVQINDAKDGARQSVAAWNDTTGTGYQDTSVYGVLTLTGKTSNPTDTGTVTNPIVPNPQEPGTLKPEVNTDNGRAIGTISGDNLKKALEQAAPAANGKKQVVIDLPAQADVTSYEVQLPAQSLNGEESFELSVKTANATIQIPSNMLSNVTTNTEQVSIRVAKTSTDNLDAATREQIGNRPVIDLNVVAGDNVIAWNNPNAPVKVAIPYTPTAEELSDPDHIVIWYIDGEGKANSVPNGRYDAASGTVVFQTTHFSTYAVVSVFKTFGDLQNVTWAKQAIDVMASRDVIKGISEDSFSPAASIKRADFIALLVRALELQGTGKQDAMFSDVHNDAYYYKELSIAKELGIANGFEDNTFKPESAISRQDMMVLTTRALAAAGKQVAVSGTLDAYSDAASISDYAKESAAVLTESGIVNGRDGNIAPKDPLTRAETAVILYRIWNL